MSASNERTAMLAKIKSTDELPSPIKGQPAIQRRHVSPTGPAPVSGEDLEPGRWVSLAGRALMKRRVRAVNLVRLHRRGRAETDRVTAPALLFRRSAFRPVAAAILRSHG
jgi:hypothetical protein